MEYSIVFQDQGRVRLAFHANNTESQVRGLVNAIFEWAQEMMQIEDGGENESQISKAARRVYATITMNDDKNNLHRQ